MKSALLAASVAAACALAHPAAAFAQAPPTAPLVLTVPSSARVAALGGAWVAGRDQDVVFTNPAQLIGVRSDFAVTLAELGPRADMGSFATVYTGGRLSFTLGFGLQAINFNQTHVGPPFDPAVLAASDSSSSSSLLAGDAQSALATVAGAVLYKNFRIGASVKYAADRMVVNSGTFLTDLGVARNLWGGTAAFAVQNLGKHALDGFGPQVTLPRQYAAGYSRTRAAGPLDLGLFGQVSHRAGWNSGAAGIEAGYSWIEGMNVTLRAGIRRPESDDEKPISLGGAFTADRLTVEYAVRLYDGSHRSHVVTMRWR